MNFASHAHIYSLYPKATFQDSIGLKITQTFTEFETTMAREKYIERGFELLDNASRISPILSAGYKFDETTRNANDGNCWKLKFNDKLRLGDDIYHSAGWALTNVHKRPMSDFVEVTAPLIGRAFPFPRSEFSEAVEDGSIPCGTRPSKG